MALSATIFKAQLNISDLRRHHYQDYTLTLALHPSETPQRMMVRLLSFCLYAAPELEFSRGLSNDDEPDLWQKNLSGDIEHWIELGQADEKRVRKACSRADQVSIIGFQQRAFELWWQQNQQKLQRFDNLSVVFIDAGPADTLTQLVDRTMQLQVTIEDGTLWLSDANHNVEVHFQNYNGE